MTEKEIAARKNYGEALSDALGFAEVLANAMENLVEVTAADRVADKRNPILARVRRILDLADAAKKLHADLRLIDRGIV